MKVEKTGTISKEEVDMVIKCYIEEKLKTKVKTLISRTKGENDPTDWRGEYPLNYVFDGYSFTAQDDEKSL